MVKPVCFEPRVWPLAHGRSLTLGPRGLIMAIVNVTPDSFSDGGQFATSQMAIEQALRLADSGAHILDIGGESTRPGAAAVDGEEERRRILPVIAALAGGLAARGLSSRSIPIVPERLLPLSRPVRILSTMSGG